MNRKHLFDQFGQELSHLSRHAPNASQIGRSSKSVLSFVLRSHPVCLGSAMPGPHPAVKHAPPLDRRVRVWHPPGQVDGMAPDKPPAPALARADLGHPGACPSGEDESLLPTRTKSPECYLESGGMGPFMCAHSRRR